MRFTAMMLALLTFTMAYGQAAVVTPDLVHPSGAIGQIDLPRSQHMKNTGGIGPGGPGTGAGLCVFTSIQHAARWHNIPVFMAEFQKWMMNMPGGGHPSKVDQMIKTFCREKGIHQPPPYMQDTSGDLNLLASVVQHGYMPGITYCFSPTGRYSGQYIAHMVNCVAARAGPQKNLWAILDNNYPGTIEWMDEKTFARTFIERGGGWFFIWLAPPPPPPPLNLSTIRHGIRTVTMQEGTKLPVPHTTMAAIPVELWLGNSKRRQSCCCNDIREWDA